MTKEAAATPEVSVIVPMYRSAEFAPYMVDCLCGQTFRNTEIIFVLDGPDEETEKILEEARGEDSRIQVIFQEHAGAGTARNNGLKQARGEYLLFLDADDLYSPELIEKLYRQATSHDADVVMCSYSRDNLWMDTSVTKAGFDYGRFPEGKAIKPSEVEDLYTSFYKGPTNKLVRRSMIEENDLRFSETHISNDLFFAAAAITSANKLVAIKEDLITVRRHISDHSISSNRGRYAEEIVVVMRELYDWLVKTGRWKTYRDTYGSFCRDTLEYTAESDYGHDFIDALARMLSQDLPWSRMSKEELVDRLDLRPERFYERRDRLQDEIHALRNADNRGREKELHVVENLISAYTQIRETMKTEYGRDLDGKDSAFASLMWSLRSRGWAGTWKMHREKRKKDVILTPAEVVCAGHLTTARTIVDFFLPENTDRTEAVIEDLFLVVRCDGYYPKAKRGETARGAIPLGPATRSLIRDGSPVEKDMIRRIVTTVCPGVGVRIEVVFSHPLIRGKKGEPAGNNQPLSVRVTGRIRLI